MSLRDFSQTESAYSFLDVTLDVSAECLMRGANEIKLRPKSFQVLRYLAERPRHLITREELLQAIWRDVVVTDESLTKCIADVRKALNDDSQQVIRTVARRGYVFTASVTRIVGVRRQAERGVDHGLSAVPPPAHGVQTQGGESFQRAAGPLLGGNRTIAAALALMVAGGTTVLIFQAVRREPGYSAAARDYTQLTNFTDAAYSPAISPDGRMLTFIRGENAGTLGGPGDVYIKLLPDGEPIQLTRDARPKMNPVFTPRGDRVTFAYTNVMTNPQGWSTWAVSVFGGEPKLMLSNASALTWIPGSSPPRVMFSRVDTGVHMSIVTSTQSGTDNRTIYAPAAPNAMAHRSFLSPDGKHVLVVEMQSGWLPCRLVALDDAARSPTSAGAGRQVGPSPGQCASAAWSPDGKWMYFSVDTGNGYHIWRQAFPQGTPKQVTFGATEEREIALDPDGRSFLTSVGNRQSTLWVHDASGDRQITHEGYASSPRFSPDGRRLYYLLRSRANRRYMSGELWSADLDSGTRERLLPEFLLADYAVSPDGHRMLVVAIAEDGTTSVWLTSLDGSAALHRVSTMTADRAFFGPQGEVFFHAADQTNVKSLYRIREDGSRIQKVIADPIIDVYDVSPDGRSVAAWRGSTVQVLSTDQSSGVAISAVCASTGGENSGTTPPCVSWSANGKYLYLNDRKAGQAYAFPIPPGRSLPKLPDGGIVSAEQASAWPGARIVQERSAFFGPDPSVYAFFRVTANRNIYRVRVPED